MPMTINFCRCADICDVTFIANSFGARCGGVKGGKLVIDLGTLHDLMTEFLICR